MAVILEEGYISGYQYAVFEPQPGRILWWVERPGGVAFWRGNTQEAPTSTEDAKMQILDALARYGINPPRS